jgi:parallel beta-helix repeat protein/predicted outer membrane repeat protein
MACSRLSNVRSVIVLTVMVCTQAIGVFANDFSKYTLDTFSDDYRAYKPNEILVRFVSSSHDSTGLFTHKAVWTRLADSVVSGARIQQDMSHVISGLAVVRLPKGVSVVEAVHAFSASADVQYAEPNYRFSLAAAPADPEFPRQWALDQGDFGDINAPEGWDIQFEAVIDDEPIIVAILDTGVDFNHPDLYLNMWEMIDFVIPDDANQDDPNFDPEDPNFMVIEHGPDFIDGDESADDPNDFFADGVPWDEHYHGTMVAGIIGASANNDEGISGVAQVVKMLPVRITEGITEEGYLSDENHVQNAVSGIGYALGAGAKIINISWTTTTYSQALYDTIQLAADANVVVVAAAGNGNIDNDLGFFAGYPASYDLENIISVMATDAFDRKASYSNYGAFSVDLAAPGGDGLNAEFKIFSTTPRTETTPMGADEVDENYGYDGFDERGTSFAAAHVSGAVALGFAIRPNTTASEMRQFISSDYAVDKLDSLEGLNVAEGRLNLAKFFQLLTPGKVTNTNTSVESFSIQEVIDDPGTQSGHEITVESGFFYMEAVDFKGMGLKLRSAEGADANMPVISAILDDAAGLPTITIEMAKDAEVDGFIIEGGDDAGILTSASTLLINNCIIRNNQGTSGGGISIRSGHPIITNTEIINNIATREGGGINVTEWPDLVNQYANLGLPPETLADILAPFAPKLTLTNCTVSGNTVLNGWGGGIAVDDSEVTIDTCQITNNQTSQDGGGLYCYLGETLVTASQFVNNSADWYGGGAFMDSESKTTLIHSIFDRNTALLSGGAISCLDTVYSQIQVKNCLLTSNISDSRDGAGIHCYNSSPKVSSCTVALNDCLQHVRRGGGLFCEADSSPIIENVIFYKNNDVAVFSDDVRSVPDLRDCLFFANQGAYGDITEMIVHLDAPDVTPASVPGTNILYGDPLFVRGSLGNYYLSHVGAGQILDAQGQVNPAGATSPAIDASRTTAVTAELMGRSVRTDNETADGIRDVGLLDLGYHYDDPLPNQPVFLDTSAVLAVAAIPANALTIEPISGMFKQYSQVLIRAAALDPDQYILTSWKIEGQAGSLHIPVDDPAQAGALVLTLDEDKRITAIY